MCLESQAQDLCACLFNNTTQETAKMSAPHKIYRCIVVYLTCVRTCTFQTCSTRSVGTVSRCRRCQTRWASLELPPSSRGEAGPSSTDTPPGAGKWPALARCCGTREGRDPTGPSSLSSPSPRCSGDIPPAREGRAGGSIAYKARPDPPA